MNDKNPTIALDAALEAPFKIEDVTVYEMSLGRYALLELTESPFIVKDKLFNVASLVPTFYIMCTPYEKLVGYTSKNIDKLYEQAMIWAETFNVEVTSQLIDAIAAKLGLVKKVAPQTSSEDSNGKVSSSKKATQETVG